LSDVPALTQNVVIKAVEQPKFSMILCFIRHVSLLFRKNFGFQLRLEQNNNNNNNNLITSILVGEDQLDRSCEK
jgi:hypothetical protein